jgi:phage baseplate assembly protein W
MSNGGDKSKKFLGVGMVFPMDVDGQGQVVLNSYEDHVRQSILLILQTAKGERVMRPDFGAGLQTLVFEPAGPATAAMVRHEVQQALLRNEPRIDVLSVQVTADPSQPGVLTINVNYRVRQTDTIYNVVYPFYIERGAL